MTIPAWVFWLMVVGDVLALAVVASVIFGLAQFNKEGM